MISKINEIIFFRGDKRCSLVERECINISRVLNRKIFLKDKRLSGTVTNLFKKFQITGPLYCKVFLPVSELNLIMCLISFYLSSVCVLIR